MELWLFYNDELMAQTLGPIMTKFATTREEISDLRQYAFMTLAIEEFEGGIPHCTKVEHYKKTDEFGDFKFIGMWTAPLTRAEAMVAKYGSLANI